MYMLVHVLHANAQAYVTMHMHAHIACTYSTLLPSIHSTCRVHNAHTTHT